MKIAPTLALLSLGLATLSVPFQPAHAQTVQASQKPVLTTLHRFDFAHGGYGGTIIFGTDGNLYGITEEAARTSSGTAFQLTPAGQFTTLSRFNGKNGTGPGNTLVKGADGNFYGITFNGGKGGAGTVFRLTPQGRLTTIADFSSSGLAFPIGLIVAPDSSFYGTTEYGGKTYPFLINTGTVFHLTLDGHITILHSFDPAMYGVQNVGASPVFGPDGALYGTTTGDGAHNLGTVYRLTGKGQYTTLHSFGGSDGAYLPYVTPGRLALGPDGALYGVTEYGGIGYTDRYHPGSGTLYKITSRGTFTTMHKFSNDGHGTNPASNLTFRPDGTLYGTTELGGQDDHGTVFEMTTQRQMTTLYKFHTAFDGQYPFDNAVLGSDGALYGTTSRGGLKGYGTIFKLTLPQ